MHVRNAHPLNWRWHWRRLQADCATLALSPPDESTLLAEIASASPAEGTVKVMLTRGRAGRGYTIPATSTPTRIVAAFPAPSWPASHATHGVAVRRCELVLSEQPRLAGAKTLNRLENVLARSEWHDAAIAEGLLGDASGHVIEGTMSNVFVVAGGRLATPALDRCGVIGAQRERIRELASRAGIACAERPIAWNELVDADEVFLANSLIRIWPVARYERREWAAGPVTRRLQSLLDEDDARA
jgi:4-amino-4-deoxychorismate lyase